MDCLKPGEKKQQMQITSNEWLRLFKIALIEKNSASLQTLQSKMPSFNNLEELKEAQALIAQAILFFQNKKSKTLQSMNELKKVISFHKTQNNKEFSSFNQYT